MAGKNLGILATTIKANNRDEINCKFILGINSLNIITITS